MMGFLIEVIFEFWILPPGLSFIYCQYKYTADIASHQCITLHTIRNSNIGKHNYQHGFITYRHKSCPLCLIKYVTDSNRSCISITFHCHFVNELFLTKITLHFLKSEVYYGLVWTEMMFCG
jgi:hypothetical protein